MTSYTQRYLNGDHETVWADLRGLGPVPDALIEDCTAVAAQTMQRVAVHIARLAARLTDLGLVPSGTLRTPPTAEDQAELDVLVREIGTVPLALEACLRHVGGVWFAGDCPALHLYYAGEDQYGAAAGILPDPLVLPDTGYLRYSWDEHRSRFEDDADSADDLTEDLADSLAEDLADDLADEGFVFDFAPDELHKADISGSTHDIPLSHRSADPVIHGVCGRPDITLVDYLRLSISWGGMPGWSFKADRTPAALDDLRVSPDF
ncbi:hypothetical protein [Streptomyces odontomachi]|uniref:hypothetical protein n=1 Tax=Streptomyces odontomachi TaxID=2944940 RepID=UPI0021088FE2|nr:hypothetical protein [Streptomyces sp. ODS25]